jgi:hypothetical protein
MGWVEVMSKTIDSSSLLEKDIEFVEGIVTQLRKKAQTKKEKGKEHIELGTWDLGVKGNLTWEEIYDYP